MTGYSEESYSRRIVKLIVGALEMLRESVERDPQKFNGDAEVRGWYLARLDKLIQLFKSFIAPKRIPFWMFVN